MFAANQAKGDKLLKEWKRKNERFRTFLKVIIESVDSISRDGPDVIRSYIA